MERIKMKGAPMENIVMKYKKFMMHENTYSINR